MKNFNQKGSKNSIAKEKRYSKSKFKNEAKAENSVQKTKFATNTLFVGKKKVTNKADNLSDFYRNKYEEKVNKSSVTFRGIEKFRTVILKAATKQVKGFSVFLKGQCVVVEAESLTNNLSLDHLLRVRAQDGRVGLADPNYVKSLNFSM